MPVTTILLAIAVGVSPPLAPLLERDLSPLLAGRPAEAGALLTAGKGAEALAAVGADRTPGALFLRALAEEATGACAEALQSSDGLGRRLPELADRLLALRGRCLETLGRHLEAAQAFSALPASSVLFGDAQVRQARALAAGGQPGPALEAMARLVDQPPPADPARPDPAAAALLLSGELRAALVPAEPAAARAALLRCWADHPVALEAPRRPGRCCSPPASSRSSTARPTSSISPSCQAGTPMCSTFSPTRRARSPRRARFARGV
jgi:tetratricopeptide (TPR) repeat protein